jgi:catechol 2,3-dioxygenase-like lactoylglutathione lyase family enzyme
VPSARIRSATLVVALLVSVGPHPSAQNPPVQAPPAQTATAGDVIGVGNFSHIVRDMDRAVAFYRDVLGLEMSANVPFSPNPAIMRLGNTPKAQSRMVAFRVPGSDMGVELIEYKDIERTTQSPRFVDPGTGNIALRVRDIAPILAKLPKSGAKIITQGDVPATINNSKFVFLQDPDGFVVELAQTPAPPADPKAPAPGNIYGAAFELTVKDSQESVTFYKDMLGIDMVLGAEFVDNPLLARTAGAPGASVRQSRAPIPGTSTVFTLIEFRNVERRPLSGRVQDPGTAILQLRVRDVDALLKKMKAGGVPVVTTGGEAVEIRPGLRIVIVRDPNNLMLELMQSK